MNDKTSSGEPDADPVARALRDLAREGGLRILVLGGRQGYEAASLLGAEGRSVFLVNEDDDLIAAARARGIEGTAVASPDPNEWAGRLAGQTFDVILIENGVASGPIIERVRNQGILNAGGFLLTILPPSDADDDSVERLGFTVTRRWLLGSSTTVVRLDPMGGAHELARLRAAVDRMRIESTRLAEAEKRLQGDVRALTRKLQKIDDSRLWRARGAVARIVRPVKTRRGSRSVDEPSSPSTRVKQRKESPPKPATPREPGLALEYRLDEDDAMRHAYEQALRKKAFETEATHIAIAVSSVDFGEPRRQALEAVALGRWLDRSGFEVIYLPPERWDEIPADTQILLSTDPDVDPLAAPSACIRLAWIRDRLEVWARCANLILSHGAFVSSETIVSQIEAIYPGPIAILRAGVDTDYFGPPTSKVERVGTLTTVPQSGRELHLYASLRTGIDFPLAIFGEQRGLNTGLIHFHRGITGPFAMRSLYHQAALVLEDSREGALDSPRLSGRVLEALASGALVLLDSSVFLREPHLDEIPTYLSGAELRAAVKRYLQSGEERGELVERLRDIVLREHTYEHRAAEFGAFARGLAADSIPSGRRFIAFYPHYQRNNPYQPMLYSRLGEHGLRAIPLTDPAQLARSPLIETRARDFLFHLHWTNPILEDASDEETARDRVASFLATLDKLRGRGVKIIWTVHNVLPHESVFPELEAALCQGVADRAELITVMCEETPRLVAPHYQLPPERVRLVAHGSYIDVYPNLITSERARNELGLDPSETVFCCFGGIRQYKGIGQLLDAFEAVYQIKPESRLVIVGPRAEFDGSDALAQRCAAHPGILSNFNRIADVDVQIFLNASDVVVLPQRAPLNSGALMLAFSFGRPVVAPRAGCVEGMVSSDVGLTFDSAKPGDLKRVLMDADQLKTRAHRDAAYQKALAYPYGSMATDFARLIGELLDD